MYVYMYVYNTLPLPLSSHSSFSPFPSPPLPCPSLPSLSLAPQLVEAGNIDYLVADYLSEVTMSLLTAAKQMSPVRMCVCVFTKQHLYMHIYSTCVHQHTYS